MSPSLTKALIRLAGLVSIISGLCGMYIWAADISDRSDGDSLRFGAFRNPLVQYPSFNVPFQEGMMEVAFWIAAVATVGGILMLIPLGFARHVVILQARASFIVDVVFVVVIVHQMIIWKWHPTRLNDTAGSLMLRLGSIVVDGALWAFLGSSLVREYFRWNNQPPEHAFPVIPKEPHASPR